MAYLYWITICTSFYVTLLGVDACLGLGGGNQGCCPARSAPICGSQVPPCGGYQQYAPPPLPQSQPAYAPLEPLPQQQQSTYYAVAPPLPQQTPQQQSSYSYVGNVNQQSSSYVSSPSGSPPANPPPSPFTPLEYPKQPLYEKSLPLPPFASRNQQPNNHRTSTPSSTTTSERTSYSSTTSSSRINQTTTEANDELESAGSADENKQTDGYNFALQDDVEFEQQQVESAQKTLESNSAEISSP
ncbi:hypothetical protein M3Y96_01152900 [Aphelenchoides besseyi]|nr:hypothetical protein M3Y96_01152900 [Aphelenchoides besseyi]